MLTNNISGAYVLQQNFTGKPQVGYFVCLFGLRV